MRWLAWFTFAFTSFGLGATKPTHAIPKPLVKTLVIIGDSITEGYDVSREQAFPALLQRRLDKEGKAWKIINAGVSGSTSASAPNRVRWHLKQKPEVIVIALGANDGLRGSSPKSMSTNLEKAIGEATSAGVTVILAGMKMPPNYGAAYTKEFDSVFPQLAQRLSVPLIPFLLKGVGGVTNLNLPDGIHPNEKGHAIVADVVYQGLRKYL